MKIKKIPLGPTLIVMVGPSGAGKSTLAASRFLPEEIVSTDSLRHEFTGDFRRQDMENVVFREADRRVCNRLEAGLRVVVDATNIKDGVRKKTAQLGQKYGVTIVYLVVNRSLAAKLNSAGWRKDVRFRDTDKSLIDAHDETFLANERKILGGDGIANVVIDSRKDTFEVVQPLARLKNEPFVDIVRRGYQGILAVGDVHGNIPGLQKMTKLANQKNLFLIYMGDIVDYHLDTLKAADYVGRQIALGRAYSIFGNHERKILKWITQSRIQGIFESDGFTGMLNPGNAVTVNQLKAMSDKERLAWETRFIGMCATMPHFLQMDRWLFTHGACGKYMWGSDMFRFYPDSTEESYALFGEANGYLNGLPNRLYNWVNKIPPRHTAIVGHDARSDQSPLIYTGDEGGIAIFLDTGSSKPDRYANGHLSAMSVEISLSKKNVYSLENMCFHSELDL